MGNLPGLVRFYLFCNANRGGVNSNLSQLQQSPDFCEVLWRRKCLLGVGSFDICQAHTRCKLGRVIGVLTNKSVIQGSVTDNIMYMRLTGKITSRGIKPSIPQRNNTP